MKRIFLIAGIFTASIISANTATSVKKSDKKSQKNKVLVLKSKKAVQRQCAVFQASCTSAYTCQDWSMEQWYNWAEQIQNNYCQLGGAYAH